MNTYCTQIIASFVLLSLALPIEAQQNRISPRERIEVSIKSNLVTVSYGRPFSKDPRTGQKREIWGGLVPYGRIWRTGADEATVFSSEKPITIDKITLPLGKYSLFMLPVKSGTSKLVFNKQTGQTGKEYNELLDVARVDLIEEPIDDDVEQFTIRVYTNAAGEGVLKMSWEKRAFSFVFQVK